MKVLFLDHQGVMYFQRHPNIGKLDSFDKRAISLINDIISDTGAEIVVSSDWKTWVTLNEMKDFYEGQGLKKPIDYTPKYEEYRLERLAEQRSIEIKGWLLEHHEVKNWVSIDDLDMRMLLNNFVLIDSSENWLTDINKKEEIIKILNKE